MSNPLSPPALDGQISADPTSGESPFVAGMLDTLRGQIHRYLLLDGLLAVIIWLTATFWIAWSLDFLPVLLGASEMPIVARRLVLLIVAVGIGVIVYRFILRRIRVPILDRQLALLIERSHPQLNEHLLTSVDDVRAEGEFGEAMLSRTRKAILPILPTVQLSRVFNYRPLVRRGILSALLIGSLVVLPWFAGDIFATAWRRLYLLQDLPYPRRTHLVAMGFTDGRMTVARGSDVAIHVMADATRPTPPPRVCSIAYELPDRTRGRVNMSRQGGPANGMQEYVFAGKPFQNILSDVQLDIRGNDYSIRGLRVHVVESPQIVSALVTITFPAYTGLLPRTVPYRAGLPVPAGSDVRLALKANKPLRYATRVEEPATVEGTAQPESPSARWQPTPSNPDAIEIDLANFRNDVTLQLALHDQDQITSSQPYRIALTVLPDLAPQIDVQLQGIGAAVTPQARLPLRGTIYDDYGVADVFLELEVPGHERRAWPARATSTREFQDALDLQQLRQQGKIPVDLAIDSRIAVSVRATDRCDLTKEPNVGQGDVFELDVVSSERLLSMLEARELGLRERFEQIVSEMQQMRDSLSRAAQPEQANADEAGAEPEDARVREELSEQGESAREGGLSLLRVQRAHQHVERAAQEVLGVALAFDDIREELINNRVDSADRQQRLKDNITRPLQQIADVRLKELARHLKQWEQQWMDLEKRQQQGSISLRQTDEVILAMEQVLARMLDLESYHELLELVRSLIQDQQALEQRTRDEQRRQILELMRKPDSR